MLGESPYKGQTGSRLFGADVCETNTAQRTVDREI